jgi:hypothetical protein
MKVSELIEKLQAMPQDLEVYSYCDHGQQAEKSSSPCVVYAEEDEYNCYENFTGCEESAVQDGWTVKFVIL